ncbi:MAG: hypothetical protein JRF33_04895, partial [Deltaproteobacteria bacterium]|nr:hypothetical protein [Deltaproteobacteria bacterium]
MISNKWTEPSKLTTPAQRRFRPDASTTDAYTPDASTTDASTTDASTTDASTTDAKHHGFVRQPAYTPEEPHRLTAREPCGALNCGRNVPAKTAGTTRPYGTISWNLWHLCAAGSSDSYPPCGTLTGALDGSCRVSCGRVHPGPRPYAPFTLA